MPSHSSPPRVRVQWISGLVGWLFAGVVAAPSLPAQPAPLPSPAPSGSAGTAQKAISVEITAVAWEHPVNDISIKGGGLKALEIPAFAESRVYQYRGSNPLVLTRNDRRYAESHPDYEPVSRQVEIPPEWKKVILPVFPFADGSFAVKAVQNDTETFPVGRARIINVSDETLAIKTRDENRVLEPQGQTIFAVPEGSAQLGFAYARQQGDAWRVAGSGAFPVPATERRTIFITKSGAEFFRQTAEAFDSEGRLATYRLPPRAFQVFTIIEKSTP